MCFCLAYFRSVGSISKREQLFEFETMNDNDVATIIQEQDKELQAEDLVEALESKKNWKVKQS